MIRNIILFFSIFILSPEFFVILSALLFASFLEVSNDWVLKNISINSDAIKYLAFIPVGLGSWVLNNSRILLFPKEEAQRILYSWDGYLELKITVFVAVAYAVLFGVWGLSTWIFDLELNTFKSLLLMFTPIIGSIVLVITIFLAKLNQDEILMVSSTSKCNT